MNFSVRFALLAGLVVGMAGLPAIAAPQQQQSPAGQQKTGQQQAGQKATTTGKPAVPAPKVNPAEEKAYVKFYKLNVGTDPQGVIASGTAFLKKYPSSAYAESVYARLTTAYEATGDDAKMFAAGKHVLQLDPNNVDVLSMLAYAIPRRVDPNNLDASGKLTEAEGYAKHALALLAKMQKPADLTDAQFTAAKNADEAACHSGLGLVYYYEHNLPGMISEFEQAVKLNPKDMSDQFLLGLAYVQAGQWANAVTPLQTCVSTPGPMVSHCQPLLAQAKKQLAAQPKPKS
jgi:tetratricopeptide (TPR) repeat protein